MWTTKIEKYLCRKKYKNVYKKKVEEMRTKIEKFDWKLFFEHSWYCKIVKNSRLKINISLLIDFYFLIAEN